VSISLLLEEHLNYNVLADSNRISTDEKTLKEIDNQLNNAFMVSDAYEQAD
jgi:hypothetical protein